MTTVWGFDPARARGAALGWTTPGSEPSASGGECRIDSVAGAGTLVSIRLPVPAGAATSAVSGSQT